MRVLGVSASGRTWGNTDILVHSVLRGALSAGAETAFLRLPELALRPCRGCMQCVFRDRDCPQEDALSILLAELRAADAVVLGSPTYVLGANGPLKNLHDRMIRYGARREFAGKPGVAVAAAGVPGWDTFALPQVSTFFLFLGMPVVDQFIGYAQGPGEILYETEALARAERAGRALGTGQREYLGTPGACPACHLDLVAADGTGGAKCLLCDLPGTWTSETGHPRLRPAEGAESRWSDRRMVHHFEERVIPSGARFKGRLGEIREKLEAFRRDVP